MIKTSKKKKKRSFFSVLHGTHTLNTYPRDNKCSNEHRKRKSYATAAAAAAVAAEKKMLTVHAYLNELAKKKNWTTA